MNSLNLLSSNLLKALYHAKQVSQSKASLGLAAGHMAGEALASAKSEFVDWAAQNPSRKIQLAEYLEQSGGVDKLLTSPQQVGDDEEVPLTQSDMNFLLEGSETPLAELSTLADLFKAVGLAKLVAQFVTEPNDAFASTPASLESPLSDVALVLEEGLSMDFWDEIGQSDKSQVDALRRAITKSAEVMRTQSRDDIWHALQQGTYLTVGDYTYRIVSHVQEMMMPEADGYCLFTVNEETGRSHAWCYDDVIHVLSSDKKVKVHHLMTTSWN